jgi:hypothetical protein
MYLRYLAGDHLKLWLQWLPWAEFCYNISCQNTVKCSPFQVVYGIKPPPPQPPPHTHTYYYHNRRGRTDSSGGSPDGRHR